jgi:hypothetical protein
MDQMRVRALTVEIGESVSRHLGSGPVHSDRVFETLNALAVTAAMVLAGTDANPVARKFFIDALAGQLEATMQERAKGLCQ